LHSTAAIDGIAKNNILKILIIQSVRFIFPLSEFIKVKSLLQFSESGGLHFSSLLRFAVVDEDGLVFETNSVKPE